MAYELVVRNGPAKGRRFALPETGEISIGREAINDLVLLERGLSRRHSLVRTDPSGVEVVDLGSANGTTIDGVRIERRPLAAGDVFCCGSVQIELVEVGRAAGAFEGPLEEATTDLTTYPCLGCGLSLWENDLRQGYAWPTEDGYVCENCAVAGSARSSGRPLRVGRYHLGQRLGRGGMGAVHRGIEPATDRPVAIKFLDFALAQDPESRRRFAREASVVSKLEHPNVIRLLEVGEVRTLPYLAMEFFDGPSLAERLSRNRRLPLSRIRTWMLQAAAALAYAHGQGVIHRDVKPGNLLVDDADVLKVVDFGVGRFMEEDRTQLTMSGQFLGTVSYASPEQIEDPRLADARSDVYGLGATLYHLVTGECPFYHESQISLIERILTHDPPPMDSYRSNIPRRLMEVVIRAMRKDPAPRYVSAEEFAGELEMLLL